MNDQLLMENMLLLLKSNMEVYVHGSLEASNEKVHQALKCGLEETLKLQHLLYNMMTECGWYTVENVAPSVIQNTLTKLQSKDN